jgi:hypothetical protein
MDVHVTGMLLHVRTCTHGHTHTRRQARVLTHIHARAPPRPPPRAHIHTLGKKGNFAQLNFDEDLFYFEDTGVNDWGGSDNTLMLQPL